MYVDIARLLAAIRLSPWRRDSRKKRSGGPSRRDVVALLRVAHELDLAVEVPVIDEGVVQDLVHLRERLGLGICCGSQHRGGVFGDPRSNLVTNDGKSQFRTRRR